MREIEDQVSQALSNQTGELEEYVRKWAAQSESHYEKKELNEAVKAGVVKLPREEINHMQRELQSTWIAMQDAVDGVKRLLPDTDVTIPFMRKLAQSMGIMQPPVRTSSPTGKPKVLYEDKTTDGNSAMKAAFDAAQGRKKSGGGKK